MGQEANCTARFQGQSIAGKARLEMDVLQFRGGDLRLSISFKQMSKVIARDGTLTVTFPDGAASFEVGPAAAKWAQKILYPPSRLQKLGVKPEWRAAAINIDDRTFLEELRASVQQLTIGRVVKNADAVFFGATSADQLSRMSRLKASLKPSGALWIVRPKARPEISERAVMAAGKASGLVDVKVVSFSSTHTAEKFVIRLKDRA